MNRCLFTGRVTFDPELKQSNSGRDWLSLGVAVPNRKKVGDEWIDDADFIYVSVFGSQARACATYLKKGSTVGIDATLNAGSQGEGENKRYRMSLIASRVEFLGGTKQREEKHDEAPRDEPIPF